ncbi:hypothetical protein EVAR_103072_1 [Eumeta japonica]|uniref:Uncharacterized protein n=1 Tax=Eumeta variegata TaxID=151549 RepID=A0A4C1WRA4_EUMVA|nr:hypothetical protein EVAR_103072_1 [Eumeta japonica]
MELGDGTVEIRGAAARRGAGHRWPIARRGPPRAARRRRLARGRYKLFIQSNLIYIFPDLSPAHLAPGKKSRSAHRRPRRPPRSLGGAAGAGAGGLRAAALLATSERGGSSPHALPFTPSEIYFFYCSVAGRQAVTPAQLALGALHCARYASDAPALRTMGATELIERPDVNRVIDGRRP